MATYWVWTSETSTVVWEIEAESSADAARLVVDEWEGVEVEWKGETHHRELGHVEER